MTKEPQSPRHSPPTPYPLPSIAHALATTLLLLALYGLTASGAFHSIDEHAVFVVARNVALHGQWDQSALFWEVPYIDQARVGLDGELYSKYGAGHSLLLAGWLALVRWLPGATLAGSAMVVDGLATALTGGLLVLAAARLGYAPRVGVVLGLLFGAATFAWVYAKTMFSEPLVALGWMAAVWVMLGGVGWRRALAAGALVAATVAVRPASVLVVPLFALPLLTREGREAIRRMVAFGLPLAGVVAALLAFNLVRFGDPMEFGYTERFDGSLWVGLTGFLFSLDRSLFLFAPPLVALAWSLPPFLRRHPVWGMTLGALGLASLLMYSVWPVFWGGPVWGPRYLLPMLPLLVLLLAPAVERAMAGGWPRVALGALSLAGVAMQFPGVVWNSLPETQTLGQRYPLWLLPPRAAWLDVAWLVQPGGAAFGTLALAALTWLGLWRGGAQRGQVAALLLGTWLLWLPMGLGQAGLGFPTRLADEQARVRLATHWRTGDVLLLNPAPYQEPITQILWWLNEPKVTVPLYGVYREPPDALGQTEARLAQILARHEGGRLWLLTEGVAPGDPMSSTERLLAEQARPVSTEWMADESRLTLFEGAREAAMQPVGVSLGVATLEQWAGALDGESVQVTLVWQPERPIAGVLHTFVQLLDAEGRLVTGWDQLGGSGFAPAHTWRPGVPVTEYLVLTLPSGVSPDSLRLVAGLYYPTTGQRLRTAEGADVILLTEDVGRLR